MDSSPDGAGRAPKAQATIREVARVASVSTATVSKFVNGGQRFSPQVEARVAAAVESLGYRSNPLARGMITGRTDTIGIAILDIRNPHFASLVRGATRVAEAARYNLLFADMAEGRTSDLGVLQALSQRVDGLVVSSRTAEPAIEWLQQIGKPVVYYGGEAPGVGLHSVCSDNYQAGFMLGCHLADLGHRRIAYVGFSRARWSNERFRGLCEASGALPGSAPVECFDVDAPVAEEGERIASAVLFGRTRPDAVVAFNDLVALGLLAEARSLGVDIPRDLSLAGFDNIIYGRYVSPTLTTVDLFSERVGETAMARVLSIIKGQPPATPSDRLPARVIARESTARRG